MSHPTDPIVQYRTSDGVLVLSVATPRLNNVDTVTSFDRELRHLARSRGESRWLIDFGNTTFFITPAVNALLVVLRGLRERGGRLVLTGVSQDVRYVLGLLRVAGVFTICPNVAAGMDELVDAAAGRNEAAEAG
jgi:anti-anti-sigma regulatory factor